MSAHDSIGIMEGAYFVSKRELVEWLRQDFGFKNVDIKECGNGFVFLKILDRLYPGKVPLKKVKPSAKQEWECLHNLKLLQAVFQDCNIRKHLEIEKLAKCNYQDNLEFLQWLKCFYDRLAGENGIRVDPSRSSCTVTASSAPLSRLRGDSSGSSNSRLLPTSCSTSADTTHTRTHHIRSSQHDKLGLQHRSLVSPSQHRGGPVSSQHAGQPSKQACVSRRDDEIHKLQDELEIYKRELRLLQTELESAERESHFFFGKLRTLEIMSSEPSRVTFTVQEVQTVLFAEEDLGEEKLVSAENGELPEESRPAQEQHRHQNSNNNS